MNPRRCLAGHACSNPGDVRRRWRRHDVTGAGWGGLGLGGVGRVKITEGSGKGETSGVGRERGLDRPVEDFN